MTTPAYPSINYKPIAGSWSKTPFLEPLRTEFDGGNQRARRRAGDNVPVITQSVDMTCTEYGTFETFLIDDLENGTLEFTMTVWTGNGFSSKTVKFEETPVASTSDWVSYVVPMKLRVLS